MSDNSNDSLGLCLSADITELSLTGETGEARTCKSISVESLSLTKISLPNKESYLSDNPPLLLTLPLDDVQARPINVFDNPPNLLSLSQHVTSTSGVTPSGTTLEGTLDDIPDFQDIAPLTSVVVLKKEPESNTTKSPESSPLQNTVQTLSPPSAAPISTLSPNAIPISESKFLQDVKYHSSMKPTSSIKSLASTTVAKTSTSGITVVENKELSHQNEETDVSAGNQCRKTKNSHSTGSVKSDTMRDISECISSQQKSVQPSQMTIFKNFPNVSKKDTPFLLYMPAEDEMQQQEAEKFPRKILGEIKSSNLNKRNNKSKSWKTLEDRSRTASNDSSIQQIKSENTIASLKVSERRARKRKNEGSINHLNHDDIKNIVKEEMNAVVSMQNDIWHKILESFLEKATEKQKPYQDLTADTIRGKNRNQKDMMMLQLPNEQAETFYQPLKIPILKPDINLTEKDEMLLQFPTDLSDEKASISNKSSIKEIVVEEPITSQFRGITNDISSVKQLDVSIQTTNLASEKNLVEVGIQSCDVDENECTNPIQKDNFEKKELLSSKKQSIMKPPVESLEYQRAVARHEIPFKMMEECKILLENIQNSANEIKDMKKEPSNYISPSDDLRDRSARVPIEPKCDGYAKSKHEIFIEQFFGNNKHQVNLNRYIDVVDLPQRTSNAGHFNIPSITQPQTSKVKKAPDFIHITDLNDDSRTQKIDKSFLGDENLRTNEVFKAKKEISRSPISSFSPSTAIIKKSQMLKHTPILNRQTTTESTSANRVEENIDPDSPELAYKSDSESSIDNYLSQHSKSGNISISDKTISKEEDIVSTKTLSEQVVTSDTENVINDIMHHSTPRKHEDVIHPPLKSPVSDGSSGQRPIRPKNPSQFSQYIASNLFKIKSAYSEIHQKEIDRSKQVNMLLYGRNNLTQSGVNDGTCHDPPTASSSKCKRAKTKTLERTQSEPQIRKPATSEMKATAASHRKPTQKSKPIVTREVIGHSSNPTVTINDFRPSNKPIITEEAVRPSSKHVVTKEVAQPSSEASEVSSDTSLPSNTEELMKAALADSNSTLHNLSPLPKWDKEKPLVPAEKAKATSHTYVSIVINSFISSERFMQGTSQLPSNYFCPSWPHLETLKNCFVFVCYFFHEC